MERKSPPNPLAKPLMAVDHDQIFKTLIEAFFAEFMVLFCPNEAAAIDFSQVEFLRKEYFTDTQRGKRRYFASRR